jgi:hypothetical protein
MTIPYISPTMGRLAQTPPHVEIQRRIISAMIAGIAHPDRIRILPGRHERLAAKHTNAADAARAGEPTPPVGANPGKVTKMAYHCAKAAHRADSREARIAALRTHAADPVLAPAKVDEGQRARLIRGSRLLTA